MTSMEEMSTLLAKVKEESKSKGLLLNVAKTKIMTINDDQSTAPLVVDGKEVERVTEFNFLGALITQDGGYEKEIRRRLAMARSTMAKFSKVWADRSVTKATKSRLVRALVFPVATYGCETWTLTKADCNKICAFELWCWRRMLRIPWTARRTNASVLQEISCDRLLTHINRQALSYFGHIARRQIRQLPRKSNPARES